MSSCNGTVGVGDTQRRDGRHHGTGGVPGDVLRQPADLSSAPRASRTAPAFIRTLRTLVVVLVGLLALIAWPTLAHAQVSTVTLNADDSVTIEGDAAIQDTTVDYSSGTDEYILTLQAGTFAVTDNSGTLAASGNGTAEVRISPASSVLSLSLDDDGNGNSYTIRSVIDPTTIANTSNSGGTDTINIGTAVGGTMDGIIGEVTVSYTASTLAILTLNDAGDGDSDPDVNLNATRVTGLAAGAVNYAGLSSLTVNAGSGGNTFTVTDTPGVLTTMNLGGGADIANVRDTGGAFTINGQGGDNAITLGATNNNVTTFGGTVTVASDGGGTVNLTISNSADATAGQAYTLTSTQLSIATPAQMFDFSSATLFSLTVNGGSGANTFTVTDTPNSPTTVRSGSGVDAVNVVDTGGPLTVDSQGGINNQVTFGATDLTIDDFGGDVTLNTTGGSARLFIDDRNDPNYRTYTVSNTQVGVTSTTPPLSRTFTYAGTTLTEMTLSAAGGGGAPGAGNTVTVASTPSGPPTIVNSGPSPSATDTVTVQAVTAGTSLTINGQAGADTVTIGNSGSAQGLQGNVSVNNALGSIALTVDNSADGPASRNVSINAGSLTGTLVNNVTVNYANLSSLTVSGGTGVNTFTVNTTPAVPTTLNLGSNDDTSNVQNTGGPLTINGQGGNDIINVTDTGAELTIDGQAGTNTVTLGATDNSIVDFDGNVTLSATGGTTVLTIDNAGDPIGRTFDVNGTSTTLQSPARSVAYGTANVSTLTLLTGAGGADRVNVTPAPSTAIAVNDALLGAPPTDTINIITTALSNTAFSGTPANGSFTATGVQTVTYTNFEELLENGSAGGGTLSLSAATYTVAEGAGSVMITVNRTTTTLGAVDVTVTPSNGTATGTDDFDPAPRTVSFTSGQTSATTNIPIVSDTLDEADETFTVTLSNPTNGATLGTPSSATVTITDDDGAPSVSVANTQAAEGARTLTFGVTLSAPSGQTVTVQYSTGGGDATGGAACTAGVDYVSATGTLTFNPGTTSQPIPVAICADAADEPDETFAVTLSNPTNVTIGTATGTGTITDDDGAPSLSVADTSQVEGNGGTSTLTFTVTLGPASGLPVTVQFATGGGTATAGTSCTAGVDYQTASGTLTFNPGETTRPVSVTICGDTVDEPAETLTLTLSNPTNASIGTGTATGTITDDDAGTGLSVSSVQQAEGNSGTSTLPFTVTLTPASGQTVTVQYSTGGGNATGGAACTAGVDYISASGTLTFTPGTTSQPVPITICADSIDEPNETFTLTLSNPVNSTIGNGTATGTILDDDGTLGLSVANAQQAEGSGGSSPLTFTVSLSTASAETVTVQYATSDGTAAAGASCVAGVDYVGASGTLTFSPGTTSLPVPVTICGDTTAEPNETFILTLSNPSNNATITTGTATGTILDDDGGGDGTTAVSVANAQQTEGNSGPSTLTFTATLNNVSSQAVTVQYSTGGGTATAGSSCGVTVDYQTTNGSLTFNPGETTKGIPVTICGDTSDEPNETFILTLSNPVNATLGTGTATGTILDDDGLPRVGLGQSQVTRNEEGTGTLTVEILLSDAPGPASVGEPGSGRSGDVSAAASGITVTVDFTTADGTARANVDYVATSGTVIFDPGDTVKTISVPLLASAFSPNNLTIQVLLTGATNAIVDPARSQVTIQIPNLPIPPRPEVKPPVDDTDKPERLTEAEQDQRDHTSALGPDDLHTEGNVVEVACDVDPPTVTIVNRDGRVTVVLVDEARERCGEVTVGDYLQVSGRKQNEQLFEADDIDVSRPR